MKFGTNDLHITLIDNQRRIAHFSKWPPACIGPICFLLWQFAGPIKLDLVTEYVLKVFLPSELKKKKLGSNMAGFFNMAVDELHKWLMVNPQFVIKA